MNNFKKLVEDYENTLIIRALNNNKWIKMRAARDLGMNRTTLVEMMKRKKISKISKDDQAREALSKSTMVLIDS